MRKFGKYWSTKNAFKPLFSTSLQNFPSVWCILRVSSVGVPHFRVLWMWKNQPKWRNFRFFTKWSQNSCLQQLTGQFLKTCIILSRPWTVLVGNGEKLCISKTKRGWTDQISQKSKIFDTILRCKNLQKLFNSPKTVELDMVYHICFWKDLPNTS